jgi:GTP cyclohydrolase I
VAGRLEEFTRALLHQIREDPPPWCDVAIGYIARCRVLGLSKFARIAHACAHRLHVQEYLVEEIVDEISRLTGSDDVAVVAPGKHGRMTMRGIQTPHLISHHCGR